MDFRFWRRKKEEDDKYYSVELRPPKLNREFIILENHKLDCKDKGIKLPSHSLYILNRAYKPIKDFYGQWNFLNNPVDIGEIYRAQFKREFKNLHFTPRSSVLKDELFIGLTKLIKKERASATRVKRFREDFFKRIVDDLRREERDDITFAMEVGKLRKDINDHIIKLLVPPIED